MAKLEAKRILLIGRGPRTIFVFLYTLGVMSFALLQRISGSETVYGAQYLDSGRDLAALWFEGYPGHDTSSYFAAAWSWYSDGVLVDPGWHWVTNLWPPGMTMQSYAILSIFGSSSRVVLISSIYAAVLWSAAITLSVRQLIQSTPGLLATSVGIPIALLSYPMQQVLSNQVMMPTGYSVAFAILGLGTVANAPERPRGGSSDVDARRTIRFVLAGLFFGISALYRVTSYVVLFAVVAVLLLLLAARSASHLRSGLQFSRPKAHFILERRTLAIWAALVCTLGVTGFVDSDSQRFGVSVAAVLAIAGLATSAMHVLFPASTTRTPPHFVVWGIGIAYAFHSLAVYMGLWAAIGARPVGPAWLIVFGAALIAASRATPTEAEPRLWATRVQREGIHRPVNPPTTQGRATVQRVQTQATGIALLAGMAAGLMLLDSWTSVVTDRSHPSVRTFVTSVPELAHGARWRTDEDWESVGAGWLLNASTNWPCKLQPERCLEIQALEKASPAPYTGNGHFSAREFRNMALVAAVSDPVGYIRERAPYFWIHWSPRSDWEGAFFLATSIWALILAAGGLRAGPVTALVAFLSLFYLLISTLPMLYILFHDYYFFPVQMGGLAAMLITRSRRASVALDEPMR